MAKGVGLHEYRKIESRMIYTAIMGTAESIIDFSTKHGLSKVTVNRWIHQGVIPIEVLFYFAKNIFKVHWSLLNYPLYCAVSTDSKDYGALVTAHYKTRLGEYKDYVFTGVSTPPERYRDSAVKRGVAIIEAKRAAHLRPAKKSVAKR